MQNPRYFFLITVAKKLASQGRGLLTSGIGRQKKALKRFKKTSLFKRAAVDRVKMEAAQRKKPGSCTMEEEKEEAPSQKMVTTSPCFTMEEATQLHDQI